MGNHKDYFVLESVLKGNYLLKSNWKSDLKQGKHNEGRVNLEKIEGLTINNFNKNNYLNLPVSREDKSKDSVYSRGINFGSLEQTINNQK
jgi:hypothetical protein